MTSPHSSWLKHGLHTQTALVGSVVVGRVALEGDLWTWHASLPHGDLLADHGALRNRATGERTSGRFLEAMARTVSTVNERDLGVTRL
jgi:hypothetical protein